MNLLRGLRRRDSVIVPVGEPIARLAGTSAFTGGSIRVNGRAATPRDFVGEDGATLTLAGVRYVWRGRGWRALDA